MYLSISVSLSIYPDTIKTNSAVGFEGFLVLLWMVTGGLIWKNPNGYLERQYFSTELDLMLAKPSYPCWQIG